MGGANTYVVPLYIEAVAARLPRKQAANDIYTYVSPYSYWPYFLSVPLRSCKHLLHIWMDIYPLLLFCELSMYVDGGPALKDQ